MTPETKFDNSTNTNSFHWVGADSNGLNMCVTSVGSMGAGLLHSFTGLEEQMLGHTWSIVHHCL